MQNYFDLATILSFLIGSVLPVVVGLVTKVTTHPAIKGATLLGLSIATGVLAQWVDALASHTPFLWQPVVLSALGAFITGVATHTAILQHTPFSNTGTPFGQRAASASALMPAEPDIFDLGNTQHDISDLDPGTGAPDTYSTVTNLAAGPTTTGTFTAPPVAASDAPAAAVPPVV